MAKVKALKSIEEPAVKPEDKISLKEQIIYGSADLFGGGQAAFLSVILLAFFTNMVGIEAGIAGTIITEIGRASCRERV